LSLFIREVGGFVPREVMDAAGESLLNGDDSIPFTVDNPTRPQRRRRARSGGSASRALGAIPPSIPRNRCAIDVSDHAARARPPAHAHADVQTMVAARRARKPSAP
jgi:hypothetical protein